MNLQYYTSSITWNKPELEHNLSCYDLIASTIILQNPTYIQALPTESRAFHQAFSESTVPRYLRWLPLYISRDFSTAAPILAVCFFVLHPTYLLAAFAPVAKIIPYLVIVPWSFGFDQDFKKYVNALFPLHLFLNRLKASLTFNPYSGHPMLHQIIAPSSCPVTHH